MQKKIVPQSSEFCATEATADHRCEHLRARCGGV